MVGGKSPQSGEPLVSDDALFYLQSVPEEKNRFTIMRYDGRESHSLLDRPINVRSKVHEYGGGAYTVGDNTLYFVLADDQRIYRLDLNKTSCEPAALTIETEAALRFADLEYDGHRQRLLAVCEDHSKTLSEPLTTLVAISLQPASLGAITTLASGCDFYSNPRLSPDGNMLCWISWMHPNMPWDASKLTVTRVNAAGEPELMAEAGDGLESLCQPRWSPDGELYVISDRSNWWNIYHCRKQHNIAAFELQNIAARDAEFATPPWTFNMSTYAFLNADEILATYTEQGIWYLCRLYRKNGHWHCEDRIDANNTVFSGIAAKNGRALFVSASSNESSHVQLYQNATLSRVSPASEALFEADISQAQALMIPCGNNEITHAFYYPPTNAVYDDPTQLPPAIVICHGGPTGSTDTALNLKIQFWTNRGFAVCDVNYRGSTGYGKLYRQRLYKQWGIVDVQDLCAAANYLVENKLADANKLIVKGSSAGGFSVLAALATRKIFKAGVSLYGIADLEILARDTHKFEARYLDKLIGAWPQEADLYKARSPIHFTDQFNCPLLVFQGLEDKVVPPNQAELIVNAVRKKGLPVAYRTFADEGHGFRNLENIQTMLNDELYFYCRVFSLPVPKSCESNLHIDNLDSSD